VELEELETQRKKISRLVMLFLLPVSDKRCGRLDGTVGISVCQ